MGPGAALAWGPGGMLAGRGLHRGVGGLGHPRRPQHPGRSATTCGGRGLGATLEGRDEEACSELLPDPRDKWSGFPCGTPVPQASQGNVPGALPKLRTRGLLVPWGLAKVLGAYGQWAGHGDWKVAVGSGHPTQPCSLGTLGMSCGTSQWVQCLALSPHLPRPLLPHMGTGSIAVKPVDSSRPRGPRY